MVGNFVVDLRLADWFARPEERAQSNPKTAARLAEETNQEAAVP